MTYSEEVLLAGAALLDGRNFEYKLGRNHFGVERDRVAAVRHILDVTLPLIAAETPVCPCCRAGQPPCSCHDTAFTTTSDIGWGAF